jgi:hypothetical protein
VEIKRRYLDRVARIKSRSIKEGGVGVFWLLGL